MKDETDNQTIDFIKNDNAEMELQIRLEQERFFTKIIWELQHANLSKTDLKIFWFVLIDVQKKQAEKLEESEPMKPFINFDINIPEIAKISEVAIPNIHRTLRKLENSFLIKEENKKYTLKLTST